MIFESIEIEFNSRKTVNGDGDGEEQDICRSARRYSRLKMSTLSFGFRV